MEVTKTWGDGRAAFRKRTDVTTQDVIEQKLHPKYVFMCVAVENNKGSAYFDAELVTASANFFTKGTLEWYLFKRLSAASFDIPNSS